MKSCLNIFILFITCGFAAHGASFLKAESFPQTIADLSFKNRLEIKTEGYIPYEGLSPYQIIEFETMEDIAHQAIEEELAQSGLNTCEKCDENGNPPPQDGGTIVATTPTAPTISGAQTPTPQPQQTSGFGYCSIRNPNIRSGQKIPFGLPVNTDDLPDNISDRAKRIAKNTNNGLFCSPYGCARKRPHEGIDIGCDAGFYQMPIYATADGTVEKIVTAGSNSSAGNYIRINHGNNWVSQYMHLDQMFVSQGQSVSAGCLIGLMGHTGGNRDQKVRKMDKNLTHLHYEIVYYGTASSITTPTNTKIPIIRGDPKLGPCGNFKSKIEPTKIIMYKY